MQAVGTKKTHQASGLVLALVASTLMLGGCGDGIFFANEGPTTTAAATDTNSTASPTPTPTPGSTTTAGTTTSGTTPTPSGGTTPTPSGGTTPTPPPPAGGGTTPTPPPPAPTPPPPAPTPSAGSIGKTLWVNNCQGCHGGNTGKGASAATTLAAIAEPKNKFGMGFLSGSIGSTEASQIATYAANPGAY
jgi:hypothetical protein